MMHSILIIGGDTGARFEKANQIAKKFLSEPIANNLVSNPDFILLNEKSIKIAQIRDLKKKLALKPYYAAKKVVLINEADRLTIPAQNALLKTLEEPPSSAVIILSVANRELILPTIISRCQIISLSHSLPRKTTEKEDFTLIDSILSSSPGKRLLLGEKYSQNRDKVVDFCQNQLTTLREALLINRYSQISPLEIVKTLHQIQWALSLLKANVNHRLVLENLLLSYPK